MEQILQTLFYSNSLTSAPTITLLIGLVISLIQCFLGYKVIRSWIAIIGFLLGAIVGYGIVYSVTNNTTYALVGTLIGAILLSVIAYKIYLAGVFVIAGVGTYFICVSYLTIDGTYLQPVSIVLAIVVAIMAVKYMRPAIIAITAFLGSFSIIEVLPVFVSFDTSLSIPIAVGLGLLGAAVQFMTTKKD